MRKSYKDGYWGKIEYWSKNLRDAIEVRDIDLIRESKSKLSYFLDRQEEIYG